MMEIGYTYLQNKLSRFKLLRVLKTFAFSKDSLCRLTLAMGLLVWICAQGYLTSVPVWTRALPPEVDDSLACLVRTLEMEQCLRQNCPALVDLRKELELGMPNPEAARQLDYAGFPFPFYHPGFSLILIGISRLGVSLTKAYKILWTLSPLLFGAGFACLLCAIWGSAPAGLALVLLAFKIFPDTGLQYLTPSNFALGVALFVWARVIARRGDAPFTLVAGTLLLLSLHPVGGVYALMALLLAFFMPGSKDKKRVGLAALAIGLAGCLVLLISSTVKEPSMVNALSQFMVFPGFLNALRGFASNLLGVIVEMARLKNGLFGSCALFSFAVALGLLCASKQSRTVAMRLLAINAIFLLASLYYTQAGFSPKADIFFRVCIPSLVIFYGAVGNALFFVAKQSLRLAADLRKSSGPPAAMDTARLWPLLLAALLIGYCVDMALAGAEQLQATVQYMTDRQPLAFDPGQTGRLLSEAKPPDKVLYTSTMAMAYYFLHGAMNLGAFYYHPSFAGSKAEKVLLGLPDLTYVVAYNPAVFHPTLEGLDEKDRCITRPDYRYSPLSSRRAYGPIEREGALRASDFRWLLVSPKSGHPPKSLEVSVKNPGKASSIELMPLDSKENPVRGSSQKKMIPSGWTGVVRFDIAGDGAAGFRLLIPARAPYRIGGMSFDNDPLLWPWKQKAQVTLAARDPVTGTVVLDYDPADLLPAPLRGRKVKVVSDKGDSVLLRIEGKQPGSLPAR